MSVFTPGPWESIIGTSSGKEVVAPNANKGKYRIARCGGADRDANSVLIAAAPDLYEALQRLVNVSAEIAPDVQSASVFTDARAALAKAPWRNAVTFYLLLLLILIALYFLPTIIAITHRKKHKNSIFLVNLVFGWMIVGWVIAYVMQDYDEELPSKWGR